MKIETLVYPEFFAKDTIKFSSEQKQTSYNCQEELKLEWISLYVFFFSRLNILIKGSVLVVDAKPRAIRVSFEEDL
jgi:hypothetical protein